MKVKQPGEYNGIASPFEEVTHLVVLLKQALDLVKRSTVAVANSREERRSVGWRHLCRGCKQLLDPFPSIGGHLRHAL
jgi:hypothetical protein